MKYIIFLLFIACKVQGQQVTYQETNCVPVIDSIIQITMDSCAYYEYDEQTRRFKNKCGDEIHVSLLEDRIDDLKLEIQTLRLLNDSLTIKLQLLLEWQEYACPVLENVGVVKTVNGYRLLVNKREMIKPAVRYYKRYKNEER